MANKVNVAKCTSRGTPVMLCRRSAPSPQIDRIIYLKVMELVLVVSVRWKKGKRLIGREVSRCTDRNVVRCH